VDWRTGIAHLDQQPVLFNDTIRENLRITRPEASDSQLADTLTAARLSGFVASLPGGLDTPLEENAFRLSGGQAQRLGLARAFLKDAPLLVLDEPTSHLDAMLENELDEAVSRLSKDRTCLIIAHRKDTVRRANRVIMLENGSVVCSGSHIELKECSNAYAALFAGDEA
jgi:ABC-type multidrug transport system fused ATPase/permease subunit